MNSTMKLLPVITIGVIFLVSIRGQDTKCDFDTDLIYFDDESLDMLKSMFRIGGNCSPISWKGLDNVNQTRNGRKIKVIDQAWIMEHGTSHEAQQIDDDYKLSSTHHKSPKTWTGLISNPTSQERSSPGLFASRSHTHIAANLKTPTKHSTHLQISRKPKLFSPRSQYNTQLPESSVNIFKSDYRKRRQNQDRSFYPGNERPLTQERVEDLFEYDTSINYKSQRRPPVPDIIYSPEIPSRPQGQQRPERFFGQNNPKQNQDNSLPFNDGHRKHQIQRTPSFFSSQDHYTHFLSGIHEKTEHPVHPDNFSPFQNQENFFQPNFQSEPDKQRRSEHMFGLSNKRRQQSQGSQNDIFNGNPRTNILRHNNQRRPQNDEDDDMEEVDGTQTTTRRFESTTLPGPPTWATRPSSCIRNCPNTPEYNPVCGSDMVTYRNPGRLRCEQRCGKASVSINHYGNCITTTVTPATTTTTLVNTPLVSTSPPTFSRNFG